MKTQVSTRGCELDPDLEARVEALAARVDDLFPGGRFSKFSLEATASARAVGLVVALDDGDTIVRHGDGPDWDRAFMDLDRRLTRAAEAD